MPGGGGFKGSSYLQDGLDRHSADLTWLTARNRSFPLQPMLISRLKQKDVV